MNTERVTWRALLAIALVATLVSDYSTIGSGSALANTVQTQTREPEKLPVRSGAVEYASGVDLATSITECPQAGRRNDQPRPLDQREIDRVEQISSGGNDIRVNQDFSCMPQNETSVAINPVDSNNFLLGQNDYRLGWGSSGFAATTDRGRHFYDLITQFPTWARDDHVDGGGDPAVVFDREGIGYYVQIRFERETDTNGIFTNRSTNGGFTWSRPCVSLGSNDGNARCGGGGDTRHPGDGVVSFFADNDNVGNFSVPFEDKEYVAAGPRPAGVTPVCFAPFSKTPDPAGSATCPNSVIGVDRIYVTWTRFARGGLFGFTAKIMESFSDDRARSWSPPKAISGSAPFCEAGSGPDNACDLNQFSTPTVSPSTGHHYVAFQSFNTPDENQYLLVRSKDGGATFEGPFFITPVFDSNYPRSGGPSAARNRPDCTPRGQGGGRAVLTNSCFRVNSGGNVVVDKRDGAFADDLYLVISDNRNGTRVSSNTDVFLFKSIDGGSSWIGPTRVNNDPSQQPANRNCTAATCPASTNTGNDQWFPWIDISERGDLNVVWSDRRLDEASTASEWPTSRTRTGNYLVWTWGAQCQVGSSTLTAGADCIASSAAVIPQPSTAIDPGDEPFPEQTTFPYRNFGITDVPSNWDYTFRNGIFAGDYNNVAVRGETAVAFWTDARNGRSSRQQVGRNPGCEQADVFMDIYNSHNAGTPGQERPRSTDELFLVTPCAGDARK